MKTKIFFLFMFCLCTSIFSQNNEVEGFLNFKWGTSPEKVRNQFPNRKGVKYYTYNKEKNDMVFRGGQFENYPVDAWIFEFYKNQLCRVDVQFECEDKYLRERHWQLLCELLEQKYGQITGSLMFFSYGSKSSYVSADIYGCKVGLIYIYRPLLDKKKKEIETKPGEEL